MIIHLRALFRSLINRLSFSSSHQALCQWLLVLTILPCRWNVSMIVSVINLTPWSIPSCESTAIWKGLSWFSRLKKSGLSYGFKLRGIVGPGWNRMGQLDRGDQELVVQATVFVARDTLYL